MYMDTLTSEDFFYLLTDVLMHLNMNMDTNLIDTTKLNGCCGYNMNNLPLA